MTATSSSSKRTSSRGFDVEKFRHEGHAMVDYIADYLDALNTKTPNKTFKEVLRVRPDVEPGFLDLDVDMMENGGEFADALTEFHTKVMPGVLHWQDPMFMSYFPSQMSYPALLGDLLSNAINTPSFSWLCNPAASEMEVIVMDAICDAFGLPLERFGWRQRGTKGLKGDKGGGVMQHSATDGMVVSAIAARDTKLRLHPEVKATNLVAYVPEVSHFCSTKGAACAGITHLRKIRCPWNDAANNWPMDVDQLEAAVKADIAAGLTPCFVTASIGATGTCSIDPINKVADIAKKYSMWFTVDAAYAGSASMVPELRHHFNGWERADTIIINGSKWFGCLFNSSFMFMADNKAVAASLNHTAVYLKSGERPTKGVEVEEDGSDSGCQTVAADTYNPVDFKDLQLSLGKNWRSLKVWTMLRTMGFKDLRNMIREHIRLAKYIASQLNESGYFEVLTSTDFGLVCFRPRGETEERVLEFLEEINKDRTTFMVNTVIESKAILRLSIAHPDFSDDDANWIINKLVTDAADFGIQKA